MLRSRTRLVALAVLPFVVALAGCGVASPVPSAGGPDLPGDTPTPLPTDGTAPDPVPTGGPTPTPTPTPTPPEEPPVVVPLATSVVVDSRLVAAYAADGTQVAVVGFDEADHAAAAERLGLALGLEPVVSTTGAIGTGCDADQAVYDFGGFLLRSPGHVATPGPIEVEVDGTATTNGIPIVSVGGVAIGLTRAEFDALVGPVVDLGSYSGRNWVGFDRVNPGAPEADAIGSLARFDDGVLAQWNAPRHLYGEC